MKIFFLLIFVILTQEGFTQNTDSLNPIEPNECTDPYLKGKNEYLTNYLKKNGYPDSSNTGTVKVYIEFYIDSLGNVLHPKIKRGYNLQFDKVALDIVRNMPKWTPAICNGITRKTRLILPITFKLQ